MSDLKKAAQQALEALTASNDLLGTMYLKMDAITALKAALEEQEQEQWPVAYLWQHSETGRTRVVMPDQVVTADENWLFVGSLYTHPPRREWVSLTEEETAQVLGFGDYTARSTEVTLTVIARAIEAALKERNT